MGNLSQLQTEIGEAGASLNEFIADNKSALTAVGAGLGGVALGVGATMLVNKIRSKKSHKRRSVKHKNIRKRNSRNRKKKYSYARTAGKRKDTSHRRIRQTKNGQPYIILPNGKARFIKKSLARNSRKRKGGRY